MSRVFLVHWNAGEAQKRLPAILKCLSARGGLWIIWPKQSSGVKSDLTQQMVRDFGLARGLVNHKVAAIDATWSGLRFVRRK